MKKYLTTFPIVTGNKKRLITTYRSNSNGEHLRSKHITALHELEQHYKIDTEYSFAYLKEQSIKKLVNKHIYNSYFYQFDLSNFFGSIDHQILLSKLKSTDLEFNKQLIAECANNKQVGLALGLIPSPYLSNIYLTEFDSQLVLRLKKIDDSIVYTRYSDDLTISSKVELDIQAITYIISALLTAVNLELNSSKTKSTQLLNKGQHIKILGLNIVYGQDINYITVGRKFKRHAQFEFDPTRKHAMDSYIKYNEQ
ncbi:reverse transcriptase domain-containing protein [Mollicutes bacterium LVI A0078]|nr:reverse transcriptase domain-containing protein [Mollicutes bacterium LVI A0075]WOO90952.1 reverse transcriptase domain-containing protein [Mollicutes bacterium LVI A0078]